jgi:arylsulfatase A-like enzyme
LHELFHWSTPILKLFLEDSDIASLSWIRMSEKLETGFANSPFFSRVWSRLLERSKQRVAETYPLGLPKYGNTFALKLEDAIDWLIEQQAAETGPNLTYCHLFPPHDPYNTRIDFYQRFAGDGFAPLPKPEHALSNGISDQENKERRDAYDEFILLVDSEFNRLYQQLAAQGTLENTWLMLTSDHGEIFERGLLAHTKPAFFDPLAKVPLLIFPPGLGERIDIHAPTSATDILATLLAISGKPIPAEVEGQLLPPFDQDYDPNRAVFLIDAQFTGFEPPDPSASIMVRKGDYKLICHFGDTRFYQPLEGIPVFELYDLESDPEELTNLFAAEPEVAADLLAVIDAKLASEGITLRIENPTN